MPLHGSDALWGDLEFRTDGSGRLYEAKLNAAQSAGAAVLYQGTATGDALLVIRPNQAVIDPGNSVFSLKARRIARRIKAASKMECLGYGFSAHFPQVDMAQDLSPAERNRRT